MRGPFILRVKDAFYYLRLFSVVENIIDFIHTFELIGFYLCVTAGHDNGAFRIYPFCASYHLPRFRVGPLCHRAAVDYVQVSGFISGYDLDMSFFELLS